MKKTSIENEATSAKVLHLMLRPTSNTLIKENPKTLFVKDVNINELKSVIGEV